MLRAVVVGGLAWTACTAAPPRATVTTSPLAAAGPPRLAVLVMPTVCLSDPESLCVPATYVTNMDGKQQFRSAPSFPALIDPVVRIKLELAGFSLTDAQSLRLETVDRVDRTITRADGHAASTSASTTIGEAPTVLSLPPGELAVAAQSVGLQAVLSSTMRVIPAKYGRKIFELTLELTAIPENTPLWSVRCAELVEGAELAAVVIASCVGDGVLATYAPDALFRRPR